VKISLLKLCTDLKAMEKGEGFNDTLPQKKTSSEELACTSADYRP